MLRSRRFLAAILSVAAVCAVAREVAARFARELDGALLSVSVLIVAVLGVSVGVLGVVREREEHTLELVVVSGMRPLAIAAGHFRAACLRGAIPLTAALPLFLVPPFDPDLTLGTLAAAACLPFAALGLGAAVGLCTATHIAGKRAALGVALLWMLTVLGAVGFGWSANTAEARGGWDWAEAVTSGMPPHRLALCTAVPAYWLVAATAALVVAAMRPLARRAEGERAWRRTLGALAVGYLVLVVALAGLAGLAHGTSWAATRTVALAYPFLLAHALLDTRPTLAGAAAPIALSAICLVALYATFGEVPEFVARAVAVPALAVAALLAFVSGGRALLARLGKGPGFGERVGVVAFLALMVFLPAWSSIAEVAPALDAVSPLMPLRLAAGRTSARPPDEHVVGFVALYGAAGLLLGSLASRGPARVRAEP